jgi:hypothetical protein
MFEMRDLVLAVKAIVESRAEVGSLLRNPGDAVIIQRGTPRWMMLKCPCGCGDDIPINLDQRAGKAWRIYASAHRGVSLYPSVWRDTGCKSHFIIWNGRILLFEGYDDMGRGANSTPEFMALVERIRETWNSYSAIHYVDIADRLGEIPWDVLDACRHLESSGFLSEGTGEERGSFWRRR